MKTQVLPITPESIALAAKLLQQGELVAHRDSLRHCRRCPQRRSGEKNI